MTKRFIPYVKLTKQNFTEKSIDYTCDNDIKNEIAYECVKWNFKERLVKIPEIRLKNIVMKKSYAGIKESEVILKEYLKTEGNLHFRLIVKVSAEFYFEARGSLTPSDILEEFSILAVPAIYEEENWRHKILYFFSVYLPESKFSFLC